MSDYERDWYQEKIDALEDALKATWPFLEEELGMLVTMQYAEAIKKVAFCLGKNVVMESRNHGMFYVKEIK